MDVRSRDGLKALRATLQNEGRMAFKVGTESMSPLIPVGTLVEVVPLPRTPEPFDIVVFWTPQGLICHYVVHCNALPNPDGERTVTTRGLNLREDLPAPYSNVLGLVVSHSMPTLLRLKIRLAQGLRSVFGVR